MMRRWLVILSSCAALSACEAPAGKAGQAPSSADTMTNDELLAAVRATNQDLARLEDRMAEAEIDRAGIDAALAGKQRQLDALKQDARSTRQIAEDAREQAYIPCLVHRLC